MSEATKPWYLSKGVLGGIMSILCLVLGALGYSVSPEEQEQLVLVVTAIGGAVGSLWGIYGRVKATKAVR